MPGFPDVATCLITIFLMRRLNNYLPIAHGGRSGERRVDFSLQLAVVARAGCSLA